MRTTLVVTILLLSLAIPAGLVLINQQAQDSKEIIAKNAPNEPRKIVEPEIRPVPELPKEKAIVQQPALEIIAELPKQNTKQLPKQEVGQPPQEPVQEAPQLPQIVPNVAREGIPEGFVLKGALLSIQRAQYSQGREAVRMDLTDAILESSSLLKPAFAEYAARYSAWESNCNRVDPERVGACRFGEPTFPVFETGITESQLSSLITLLSPITPSESVNRDGDIERQYGVWVVYRGNRHLTFVNALWVKMQQVPAIEVRPQGYTFKGTLLKIARAQGIEGRDYVRAQLGDADVAPFLQLKGLHSDADRTFSLKQALEEIHARTTYSESLCPPAAREFCPERPFLYLELTEEQTIALVNLANPLLNSTQWFRERAMPNGTLERYWDSVITFNGIRYPIMIGTVWAP